ncbi:hypothetical protein CL659_01015 [bacterium]|nr:hypothetical protein [bacterium]|tara:strand:- start:18740 stop:19771 length:1032 start_codon:yes stop_codon:yes gene_type:complete
MRVLVIGGTRFMGMGLVDRLLKDGHELFIMTRGISSNPFENNVRHVFCDRFDSEAFKHELTKLKNEFKGEPVFDAVVDFLSFNKQHSQDFIDVFSRPGLIGHFIHISTGSVYAVGERYHDGLISEKDFYNPLAKPWQNNIESWNYGTGKREAENVLEKAWKDFSFPETRIRIPIVEGPYDYTLRSWKYQLWLQSGKPIDLPDGGRFKFTHVFSEDVVDAILSIIKIGSSTYGNAFNLAQEEQPSLKVYLTEMARVIGIEPTFKDVSLDKYWSPLKENKVFSKSKAWQPYASWLKRDSCLSIEKAKKYLSWTPTPMSDALKKTCLWFDSQENPFAKPSDQPWLS